jgi:hypothetical protein
VVNECIVQSPGKRSGRDTSQFLLFHHMRLSILIALKLVEILIVSTLTCPFNFDLDKSLYFFYIVYRTVTIMLEKLALLVLF